MVVNSFHGLVQKNQLTGVGWYQKNKFIYCMKMLSESIRNFCEGFISFYTSIFDEMKSW
jgi:hypothetical protein